MEQVSRQMKYKTIDLCAGIGGIRRGFEMTGMFENVLSAEIDKYACMTYEHLYGDNPQNDLTSEEFKKKVEATEYDVLLAGFPCQSFSRQGNELGFDDKKRGVIFYHLANIIKRTNPKAIFLENVDNLVHHDNGHTFKVITTELEKKLDYKIIGVRRDEDDELVYDEHDFVRNSRYFGVPQNRKRTYLMAFSRGYFREAVDALPEKLPEKNDLELYQDLNDLLEPGAPPKYYLSSGYLATLFRHRERNHKKGNGFGCKVVNEKGIEHPVANTILATGGSGRERNLVRDPQPGIAGQICPPKKTPLNDQCIRFMTPREWGKLQGFIGYAFACKGEVQALLSRPQFVFDVPRARRSRGKCAGALDEQWPCQQEDDGFPRYGVKISCHGENPCADDE